MEMKANLKNEREWEILLKGLRYYGLIFVQASSPRVSLPSFGL